MSTSNQSIDEKTVERLLKMRGKQRAHLIDDCDETEAISLVLAGGATPDQMGVSSSHIASCGTCREAVLKIHELIAKGIVEPDNGVTAPHKAQRKKTGKNVSLMKTTVAAVIVIGLTAVLFVLTGKDAVESDTRLVPKGHFDSLFVAVQREAKRFTARPMDKLENGDILGLFYSVDTKGFLAVFALDDKGNTTVLYPTKGEKSASISVGSQVPLPDNPTVTEGAGCEWIVAIFSNEPQKIEYLNDIISNAKRNNIECELQLSIPDVRTLSVFPVTR